MINKSHILIAIVLNLFIFSILGIDGMLCSIMVAFPFRRSAKANQEIIDLTWNKLKNSNKKIRNQFNSLNVAERYHVSGWLKDETKTEYFDFEIKSVLREKNSTEFNIIYKKNYWFKKFLISDDQLSEIDKASLHRWLNLNLHLKI